MTTITLPALSIRQPWAWLIVRPDLTGDARAQALAAGHVKTVENRDWPTHFRGRFLIHASKGCTRAEHLAALRFAEDEVGLDTDLIDRLMANQRLLPRGGIVGTAEIVGCNPVSESPWFVGDFGFELASIRALPFHQCRGALGFFKVEVMQDYLDSKAPTPEFALA